MSARVLGVDPGKTGAVVMLRDDGALLHFTDMVVLDKIVSPQLLASALRRWHCEGSDSDMAVIEDVHAMPKQGVSSSFSFGRSLGVAEGVVAGAGWPLTYVSPAKWKRDLGLSNDKGASRRRAAELWPSRAELFARVKDDGRAEAALIAHWWLTRGRGAA